MAKNHTSYSDWLGVGTNLTIGSVGGYIIKGLSGAGAALVAGVTDEILINNNITTKHYLTSTALWSSIILPITQLAANLIPGAKYYTIPIHAVSLGLAGGIAYFGNDPLNYKSNLKDCISNLTPMVQLFDDNNVISNKNLIKLKNTLKTDPIKAIGDGAQDLYSIYNNQLIKTLTINFFLDLFNTCMNSSFTKYVGNNGHTMLALTLIAQNPQAKLNEIAWLGTKFSTLWCIKNIITSGINYYKQSLDNDLKTSLETRVIKKILLNEEYVKKILNIDKIDEITSSFSSDLDSLFWMGKNQLENITSKKISEIIAFKDIVSIAPESLLLAQLFGFVKRAIENYSLEQDNLSAGKLNNLYMLKNSIKTDLANNYKNVILTNSQGFIKEKYSSIVDEYSTISNRSNITKVQKTSALEILSVIENFLDVLYYGYKIIYNNLTVEQAPLLKAWNSSCSSLLQGGVIVTFGAGVISKERVEKVLEAISSDCVNSLNRTYNTTNEIKFNDYDLFIENNLAVSIQNLSFNKKHHAILGVSGLGKTTILKDLTGCLTKPHTSCGELSLPKIGDKLPEILYIDQNLYIPAKATLFEAITLKSMTSFSNEVKKELEEKIIELFETLQIDEFAKQGEKTKGLISLLHNEDFNSANLSGGQKKKIGIIKAIINKPDILVADEIFVGLDKESLFNAQKMLTKHLPDTKFIIVDHYADNNNYLHNSEPFYDYCIELKRDGYDELNFKGIEFEEREISGDSNN